MKIQVTNNHGLKLATEIDMPSTKGNFPVVFILHGFTGYKEENNLVDIAQRLKKIGIASVRFTTSGFGDSGGNLKQDYRFSNYISDLDSIYQYILGQSFIDPLKVGVCGHSMGGKLSILFSAKHPEIKALCFISAPLFFLSTEYGTLKEEWKTIGYFEKISSRDQKVIRIPYAYLDDVDKYDVLEAARKVLIPTLAIAGATDKTVFWQDTKRISDEIKGKHNFILLDNVDHFYKRKPELLPIVHEPIVNFFRENLIGRTNIINKQKMI